MKTKKVTATALPSEKAIQKWVDQLAGVAQLVGEQGAVLTPLARKRMARALKGGKDLLPSLQRMAVRHDAGQLAPADPQLLTDLVAAGAACCGSPVGGHPGGGHHAAGEEPGVEGDDGALHDSFAYGARSCTLQDELQPAPFSPRRGSGQRRARRVGRAVSRGRGDVYYFERRMMPRRRLREAASVAAESCGACCGAIVSADAR